MEVKSTQQKSAADFAGRSVLSLESRRAAEIATLIQNLGGRPIVAPATREVPATASDDVPRFVSALKAGELRLVIFLTGVGTRALARAVEPFCSREDFVSSLSRVPVLARGPKPVAALKELGVPIRWNVPEPNTWREILYVLDDNRIALKGQCVAVQEYGVPSKDLLAGLKERGAQTMTVHTYNWALPENVAPLQDAVRSVINGDVGIAMFTAAVQVHHFLQVAEEMGQRNALITTLQKTRIASIGPVTSEALAEYGLTASMEPTHPKMGFLVKEAAALP